MNFTYTKESNLTIGQKLFGIIAVSRYTYDGVHPITVDCIDYNNECIIFQVDQPCRQVFCSFSEVESFVFETEEEAKNQIPNLEFGEGLNAYYYY